MTNNGSRRRGKVQGFLRHGHRSLSDRVPAPVFASAAYHRVCLRFARRFLSERAFRHTFPLGIMAKSTPDLSLSEGFIQLSKNRRKKIPSLYLPEKMAFSQKSDENNFSLFYGSNFSPHFCSRKNRRFHKKVMKIFFTFLCGQFFPSLL